MDNHSPICMVVDLTLLFDKTTISFAVNQLTADSKPIPLLRVHRLGDDLCKVALTLVGVPDCLRRNPVIRILPKQPPKLHSYSAHSISPPLLSVYGPVDNQLVECLVFLSVVFGQCVKQ